MLSVQVGTEDGLESMKVVAYPNPVNAGASFRVAGLSEREVYTISLISIDGKEYLLEESSGTSVADIKLGNVVPGLYFLRVRSGDEQATRKLIVR